MMTKYWKKKTDVIILPNQESAAQSCGVNNVKQTLKAATEPTPADGSAIFMNPKDKPSKNGKKGFAELIETEVNK